MDILAIVLTIRKVKIVPYKQIHWIKLEKRLINDHRFFLMSEKAQLYYVKLLMLCAITNNKVPRKYAIFKTLLRTDCNEKELDSVMSEIKNNFPKVLFHKDFYTIKEFKSKHNWVFPRNSQGTPMELVDKSKNKIKKERVDRVIEEYIKLRNWGTSVKNNPTLLTDIYKRNGKAAKNLLLLANNDSMAIKAINIMAEDYKPKNLTWTLETVIRHYPDLIKPRQSSRRMPS